MTEPLVYPVHPGSGEDSLHILFQSSHSVIVYELSTMKCIHYYGLGYRVLFLEDSNRNSCCHFNCTLAYLNSDEKVKDNVLSLFTNTE